MSDDRRILVKTRGIGCSVVQFGDLDLRQRRPFAGTASR